MQTLTIIRETLNKTLNNLTDSVNRFSATLGGQTDNDMPLSSHQDSMLKRFDLYYTYSLKYGAALLRAHYQIKLRITTPKKIFNALYQKQLITQKELNILLDTVKIKSLSKKGYDPKDAAQAIHAILEILPAIKQISQKLTPEK